MGLVDGPVSDLLHHQQCRLVSHIYSDIWYFSGVFWEKESKEACLRPLCRASGSSQGRHFRLHNTSFETVLVTHSVIIVPGIPVMIWPRDTSVYRLNPKQSRPISSCSFMTQWLESRWQPWHLKHHRERHRRLHIIEEDILVLRLGRHETSWMQKRLSYTMAPYNPAISQSSHVMLSQNMENTAFENTAVFCLSKTWNVLGESW